MTALLVSTACGWMTERRLVGRWKTQETPERTLDLYPDRTFSLRLSGKGLGFLSDLTGPQKGSWRVDGQRLILLSHDDRGGETTRALTIDEITGESLVLGQERWIRVAP